MSVLGAFGLFPLVGVLARGGLYPNPFVLSVVLAPPPEEEGVVA